MEFSDIKYKDICEGIIIKTIGIVPNTYKDTEFLFTKNIIKWIIKRNLKPILTKHIAKNTNLMELGVDEKDFFSIADFIVVLGGDGSILKVAGQAAINDTPILGINLGTLGYLTDVEKSDCFLALENILEGKFALEKRMMLEAKTKKLYSDNMPFLALNDICIVRGYYNNIVTLELFINNEYIDEYRADGMIVSTPTGSTAYNLSAGGPILKPDSKMIALTPICSHMLNSRSFVISGEDVINLKVINKRADIVLALDGHNILSMENDDIVEILSSKYYTTIIKTYEAGFYDILRKKMVMSGK